MDSLFTGGAEYSTLLLIEWLSSHHYNIILVLLKEKVPSYNLSGFRLDGVQIIQMKEVSFSARVFSLNKIIKEYQPELVHSVLMASNFLCRCIRFINHHFIHVESLVNQPYSMERLKDKTLKPWKINVLRCFDKYSQYLTVQHFHANSQSVADHYHKELGIPTTKITVIPRGRAKNQWISQKTSLRSKLNEELGINPDHLVLMNTGRHEHQKGQDLLLEAFRQCKSKSRVMLLIAGREGLQTNKLNELIHTYDLDGNVKLLGHRNDISILLAAADAFVFPSRYEGMPGALIEACAAGLPVICTNLPCMTEVVVPGANAFVTEPENPIDLAVRIDDLMFDKPLRSKMGKKSIELFESKFTLSQIHLQVVSLYLRLLSH